MCLGVPTRILEIDPSGVTALAEAMGVKMKISLELLPEEVKEGDFVIVHVGYAISRLNEEEAIERLNMIQEMLRGAEDSS